jgi:hypothetical protein
MSSSSSGAATAGVSHNCGRLGEVGLPGEAGKLLCVGAATLAVQV